MKFSDRILKRTESKENPLPHLKNWIAESKSLQSAMSEKLGPDFQWLPHFTNSREAICLYLLTLFLPPWNTDKITTRLGNQAYFQRYAGGWDKLQKILEQVPDLAALEEHWQEFFSEDEFFGNILREMNRMLARNRLGPTSQPYSSNRKPRRLIRHRGYRDKGSLRPYHQRGRNLPDPDPGEDRRKRISHPILSSGKGKNIYAEEGCVGRTHLPEQKGEDYADTCSACS